MYIKCIEPIYIPKSVFQLPFDLTTSKAIEKTLEPPWPDGNAEEKQRFPMDSRTRDSCNKKRDGLVYEEKI